MTGLNPEGSPSSTCLPPLRAATAPPTSRTPSSCCCPCCRTHTSRWLAQKHSRVLARLHPVKEVGRPHGFEMYQMFSPHLAPDAPWRTPGAILHGQYGECKLKESILSLTVYGGFISNCFLYVNLNLHGFILIPALHLKFIHQYSFLFSWPSTLY